MISGMMLFLLAFGAEIIDSSVGMGYGTILSPLLILIGYAPKEIIPAILFSQMVGGFLAGIFHDRYRNVIFLPNGYGLLESMRRGLTPDLRFVLMVAGLSLVVTASAVFLMLQVSTNILKIYIGTIVFVGGIFLLFMKKRFQFSKGRLFLIGLIATFNKGFTGGGFGPVLTGGQILGGQSEKRAIGCTTLSEGPVCFIAFVSYAVLQGVSQNLLSFLFPMVVGAALGGPIGPVLIKKIDETRLRSVIGALMVTLGAMMLLKVIVT